MIDHRTISKDLIAVCDKHKLSKDSATKCLIYTATKLIQKQFKVSDVESAEILSKAAIFYRDEIKRVERMFSNKG